MTIASFRLNTLSAAMSAAAAAVVASGGTATLETIGGVLYKTHRFTDTGSSTFTVTGAGSVDILLVGGGSGGQTGQSGGGGAGGVLRKYYAIPVTAQAYTINVGSGGDYGPNAGGSSTGLGYTATGGLTTTQTVTAGQSGQHGRNNADFNGGKMFDNFSPAAGGAGAGGAGGDVGSNSPGAGGIGALDEEFTASATRYGGGGGGGGGAGSEAFGAGGAGGGGRGANGYGGSVSGTNGLGGGGGGRSGSGPAGANGGSGIVIIRYPVPAGTRLTTSYSGTIFTASSYFGDSGLGYSTGQSGTRTFAMPAARGANATTIEFFAYKGTESGSTPNSIFEFGEILLQNRLNTSQQQWGIISSSSQTVISQTGNGTANAYQHICFQTTGNGTWTWWVNGYRTGTFSASVNTTQFTIGRLNQFSSGNFTIRFDEIRVSSITRYNASTDLTVPTAPFVNDSNTVGLFHCETTTQLDDDAS